MKNLGPALKQRRKQLQLTQQAVGRYAGCGALFVHQVEAGKTTVRLDKLIDVLTVLGLELALRPGKQGLQVDDPESSA